MVLCFRNRMERFKGGDNMFRISYLRNEVTMNYHVTLHVISQTIVLTPGFFKKVIGMQGNVVAGCRDVNSEILIELGFVFPSRMSRKIG